MKTVNLCFLKYYGWSGKHWNILELVSPGFDEEQAESSAEVLNTLAIEKGSEKIHFGKIIIVLYMLLGMIFFLFQLAEDTCFVKESYIHACYLS